MEKRLYRSRRERMVSGVCGGIADYFNVDPTLVRVIWVLVTLTSGGLGLLAYVAAIIIVPEEPRTLRQDAAAGAPGNSEGGQAAGETTAPEAGATVGADGTGNSRTEVHTWTHNDTDRHSGRMIAGLTLVVLGGYFLLQNLLLRFIFLQGRFLWPVLVIFVGLLVLARGLRRRD
ncbi:MAG: PspC domain-containing protein [Symbiobacteriia bacterium]